MNAKIPKTIAQTEFLDSDGTNSILGAVVDALYPVGSIYLTIGELPEIFGQVGTWEQIAEGSALWTATSDGGGTIAAGIPDIWADTNCTTGSSSPLFIGSGAPWVKGAFSPMKRQSMTCTPVAGAGSDKDRVPNLQFRASEGQVKTGTSTTIESDTTKVVYGKSDTVQPPAYKVYAWRRTA